MKRATTKILIVNNLGSEVGHMFTFVIFKFYRPDEKIVVFYTEKKTVAEFGSGPEET